MNRFRLTSLFALFAVLGLLVAGCGDDKTTTSASSNLSPEKRVKTALKNASKIESGSVTIDASLSGAGLPGKIKLSGGGDFDVKAEGGPAVDISVKFDMGFGEPQEIGIVSVGGKSYLKFGGKFYAGDDMFKGASGSTGSSSTSIDPKQLQEMIDSLEGYVGAVKASGTKQVGDETLAVYSAEVDVKKAVAEAKKQAGSALDGLAALGGTDALTGGVENATVLIGIDSNDLPRSFEIETKVDAGTTGGTSGSSSIEASMVLTEVNNDVTIEKPAKVEAGAGLLDAFGSMFGGMGATGLGQ